jgi:mRNA interferase MazF
MLKTQPCIVLTSDILNTRRNTGVVVPLTSSSLPKPPLLVGVCTIGRPAVAVTDQIRAVTKERFQQKLGDLSPAEMTAIEDGLREVLELS